MAVKKLKNLLPKSSFLPKVKMQAGRAKKRIKGKILKFKQRYNLAFTLLEVMVVISIISLLSSIVLTSTASARRAARDTKRIADMLEIRKALEMYYNDYGYYPVNESDYVLYSGAPPSFLTANPHFKRYDFTFYGSFLPELINKGYLSRTIKDPYDQNGLAPFSLYIDGQMYRDNSQKGSWLFAETSYCQPPLVPAAVLAFYLESDKLVENPNFQLCDYYRLNPTQFPLEYCMCLPSPGIVPN